MEDKQAASNDGPPDDLTAARVTCQHNDIQAARLSGHPAITCSPTRAAGESASLLLTSVDGDLASSFQQVAGEDDAEASSTGRSDVLPHGQLNCAAGMASTSREVRFREATTSGGLAESAAVDWLTADVESHGIPFGMLARHDEDVRDKQRYLGHKYLLYGGEGRPGVGHTHVRGQHGLPNLSRTDAGVKGEGRTPSGRPPSCQGSDTADDGHGNEDRDDQIDNDGNNQRLKQLLQELGRCAVVPERKVMESAALENRRQMALNILYRCVDLLQESVDAPGLEELLTPEAVDSLVHVLLQSRQGRFADTAATLLEWAVLACTCRQLKGWAVVQLSPTLGALLHAMNDVAAYPTLDVRASLRLRVMTSLRHLLDSICVSDGQALVSSQQGLHLAEHLWMTLLDLCPLCELTTWSQACHVITALARLQPGKFPGLAMLKQLPVHWTLYHATWATGNSGKVDSVATMLHLMAKDEFMLGLLSHNARTLTALICLIRSAHNLPQGLRVVCRGLRVLAGVCQDNPALLTSQIAQRCPDTAALFEALLDVLLLPQVKNSTRSDATFVLRQFLPTGDDSAESSGKVWGRHLFKQHFMPLSRAVSLAVTSASGGAILDCILQMWDYYSESEQACSVKLLSDILSYKANWYQGLVMTTNLVLLARIEVTSLCVAAAMNVAWEVLMLRSAAPRPGERLLLASLGLINALLSHSVSISPLDTAAAQTLRTLLLLGPPRENMNSDHAEPSESCLRLRELALTAKSSSVRVKAARALYWIAARGRDGLHLTWAPARVCDLVLKTAPELLKSPHFGLQTVAVLLLLLALKNHTFDKLHTRQLKEQQVDSHVRNFWEAHRKTLPQSLRKITSTVLQALKTSATGTINVCLEELSECENGFMERVKEMTMKRHAKLSVHPKDTMPRIQKNAQKHEIICRQRLIEDFMEIYREETSKKTLLLMKQNPHMFCNNTFQAGCEKGANQSSNKLQESVEKFEDSTLPKKAEELESSLRDSLTDPDTYLDFGFKVVCRECVLNHAMAYTLQANLRSQQMNTNCSLTLGNLMNSCLRQFHFMPLLTANPEAFKQLSNFVGSTLQRYGFCSAVHEANRIETVAQPSDVTNSFSGYNLNKESTPLQLDNETGPVQDTDDLGNLVFGWTMEGTFVSGFSHRAPLQRFGGPFVLQDLENKYLFDNHPGVSLFPHSQKGHQATDNHSPFLVFFSNSLQCGTSEYFQSPLQTPSDARLLNDGTLWGDLPCSEERPSCCCYLLNRDHSMQKHPAVCSNKYRTQANRTNARLSSGDEWTDDSDSNKENKPPPMKNLVLETDMYKESEQSRMRGLKNAFRIEENYPNKAVQTNMTEVLTNNSDIKKIYCMTGLNSTASSDAFNRLWINTEDSVMTQSHRQSQESYGELLGKEYKAGVWRPMPGITPQPNLVPPDPEYKITDLAEDIRQIIVRLGKTIGNDTQKQEKENLENCSKMEDRDLENNMEDRDLENKMRNATSCVEEERSASISDLLQHLHNLLERTEQQSAIKKAADNQNANNHQIFTCYSQTPNTAQMNDKQEKIEIKSGLHIANQCLEDEDAVETDKSVDNSFSRLLKNISASLTDDISKSNVKKTSIDAVSHGDLATCDLDCEYGADTSVETDEDFKDDAIRQTVCNDFGLVKREQCDMGREQCDHNVISIENSDSRKVSCLQGVGLAETGLETKNCEDTGNSGELGILQKNCIYGKQACQSTENPMQQKHENDLPVVNRTHSDSLKYARLNTGSSVNGTIHENNEMGTSPILNQAFYESRDNDSTSKTREDAEGQSCLPRVSIISNNGSQTSVATIIEQGSKDTGDDRTHSENLTLSYETSDCQQSVIISSPEDMSIHTSDDDVFDDVFDSAFEVRQQKGSCSMFEKEKVIDVSVTSINEDLYEASDEEKADSFDWDHSVTSKVVETYYNTTYWQSEDESVDELTLITPEESEDDGFKTTKAIHLENRILLEMKSVLHRNLLTPSTLTRNHYPTCSKQCFPQGNEIQICQDQQYKNTTDKIQKCQVTEGKQCWCSETSCNEGATDANTREASSLRHAIEQAADPKEKALINYSDCANITPMIVFADNSHNITHTLGKLQNKHQYKQFTHSSQSHSQIGVSKQNGEISKEIKMESIDQSDSVSNDLTVNKTAKTADREGSDTISELAQMLNSSFQKAEGNVSCLENSLIDIFHMRNFQSVCLELLQKVPMVVHPVEVPGKGVSLLETVQHNLYSEISESNCAEVSSADNTQFSTVEINSEAEAMEIFNGIPESENLVNASSLFSDKLKFHCEDLLRETPRVVEYAPEQIKSQEDQTQTLVNILTHQVSDESYNIVHLDEERAGKSKKETIEENSMLKITTDLVLHHCSACTPAVELEGRKTNINYDRRPLSQEGGKSDITHDRLPFNLEGEKSNIDHDGCPLTQVLVTVVDKISNRRTSTPHKDEVIMLACSHPDISLGKKLEVDKSPDTEYSLFNFSVGNQSDIFEGEKAGTSDDKLLIEDTDYVDSSSDQVQVENNTSQNETRQSSDRVQDENTSQNETRQRSFLQLAADVNDSYVAVKTPKSKLPIIESKSYNDVGNPSLIAGQCQQSVMGFKNCPRIKTNFNNHQVNSAECNLDNILTAESIVPIDSFRSCTQKCVSEQINILQIDTKHQFNITSDAELLKTHKIYFSENECSLYNTTKDGQAGEVMTEKRNETQLYMADNHWTNKNQPMSTDRMASACNNEHGLRDCSKKDMTDKILTDKETAVCDASVAVPDSSGCKHLLTISDPKQVEECNSYLKKDGASIVHYKETANCDEEWGINVKTLANYTERLQETDRKTAQSPLKLLNIAQRELPSDKDILELIATIPSDQTSKIMEQEEMCYDCELMDHKNEGVSYRGLHQTTARLSEGEENAHKHTWSPCDLHRSDSEKYNDRELTDHTYNLKPLPLSLADLHSFSPAAYISKASSCSKIIDIEQELACSSSLAHHLNMEGLSKCFLALDLAMTPEQLLSVLIEQEQVDSGRYSKSLLLQESCSAYSESMVFPEPSRAQEKLPQHNLNVGFKSAEFNQIESVEKADSKLQVGVGDTDATFLKFCLQFMEIGEDTLEDMIQAYEEAEEEEARDQLVKCYTQQKTEDCLLKETNVTKESDVTASHFTLSTEHKDADALHGFSEPVSERTSLNLDHTFCKTITDLRRLFQQDELKLSADIAYLEDLGAANVAKETSHVTTVPEKGTTSSFGHMNIEGYILEPVIFNYARDTDSQMSLTEDVFESAEDGEDKTEIEDLFEQENDEREQKVKEGLRSITKMDKTVLKLGDMTTACVALAPHIVELDRSLHNQELQDLGHISIKPDYGNARQCKRLKLEDDVVPSAQTALNDLAYLTFHSDLNSQNIVKESAMRYQSTPKLSKFEGKSLVHNFNEKKKTRRKSVEFGLKTKPRSRRNSLPCISHVGLQSVNSTECNTTTEQKANFNGSVSLFLDRNSSADYDYCSITSSHNANAESIHLPDFSLLQTNKKYKKHLTSLTETVTGIPPIKTGDGSNEPAAMGVQLPFRIIAKTPVLDIGHTVDRTNRTQRDFEAFIRQSQNSSAMNHLETGEEIHLEMNTDARIVVASSCSMTGMATQSLLASAVNVKNKSKENMDYMSTQDFKAGNQKSSRGTPHPARKFHHPASCKSSEFFDKTLNTLSHTPPSPLSSPSLSTKRKTFNVSERRSSEQECKLFTDLNKRGFRNRDRKRNKKTNDHGSVDKNLQQIPSFGELKADDIHYSLPHVSAQNDCLNISNTKTVSLKARNKYNVPDPASELAFDSKPVQKMEKQMSITLEHGPVLRLPTTKPYPTMSAENVLSETSTIASDVNSSTQINNCAFAYRTTPRFADSIDEANVAGSCEHSTQGPVTAHTEKDSRSRKEPEGQNHIAPKNQHQKRTDTVSTVSTNEKVKLETCNLNASAGLSKIEYDKKKKNSESTEKARVKVIYDFEGGEEILCSVQEVGQSTRSKTSSSHLPFKVTGKKQTERKGNKCDRDLSKSNSVSCKNDMFKKKSKTFHLPTLNQSITQSRSKKRESVSPMPKPNAVVGLVQKEESKPDKFSLNEALDKQITYAGDSPMASWRQMILDCVKIDERKKSEQDFPFNFQKPGLGKEVVKESPTAKASKEKGKLARRSSLSTSALPEPTSSPQLTKTKSFRQLAPPKPKKIAVSVDSKNDNFFAASIKGRDPRTTPGDFKLHSATTARQRKTSAAAADLAHVRSKVRECGDAEKMSLASVSLAPSGLPSINKQSHNDSCSSAAVNGGTVASQALTGSSAALHGKNVATQIVSGTDSIADSDQGTLKDGPSKTVALLNTVSTVLKDPCAKDSPKEPQNISTNPNLNKGKKYSFFEKLFKGKE